MSGVVLFDLDGTLSEPRGPVSDETCRELIRLQDSGFRVGIVTGSGLQYVLEQFRGFGSEVSKNLVSNNIELLPCNGTQRYLPQGDGKDFKMVSPAISMRDELGWSAWYRLQRFLAEEQARIIRLWDNLPYTGNFVSYRTSLLNWCPIGRDAGPEDRKIFEDFDRQDNFRRSYLNVLKGGFEDIRISVTVKLGGSTSFDIYPRGWDKSYALRWYSGEEVWFVGDRCGIDGNDHEIYVAVKSFNRGIEVKSPADIPDVINTILNSGG